MLLSSVKVQLRVMRNSREFQAAFLLVFTYAVFSFLFALKEFQYTDLSAIKDANEQICYTKGNGLWSYFSMLYPFIIALPFSTSYLDDCKNQLLPVYLSRSSRRNYYLSKLIAAFCGTFLVIAVPFLLNLLACNLFFPHNHNTWMGEYQLGNYYRNLLGTNLLYEAYHPRMLFLRLYLFSPALYNMLYLFIFASYSGLLGMFVLSLSFWKRVNKILLFIPMFVILQCSQVFDAKLLSDAIDGRSVYLDINLLDNVIPSTDGGCSPLFLFVTAIIFLAAVCCATVYVRKNDLEGLQ